MAAQGEIHGKPIIALFVCDTGPIKEAEKRVGSIKAFGSPVGDVIQRRTYVSQQSLLDATQPKGRRYYWKSEYLPKLEAGLLAKTIEHAERIVSPHSVILLFPLDGALNGLPESHSPMGIAMQRRSSTRGLVGRCRGRYGEPRVGAHGLARHARLLGRRGHTSTSS